MTDPGRYMLNMPGNGTHPYYIADPQIRIQKWGANLRTNCTNVESSLLGITLPLTRDCIVSKVAKSEPVLFPTSYNLTVAESRTVMPAWTLRDTDIFDVAITRPSYLPIGAQENVCLPFANNLSSRIEQKNTYKPCHSSHSSHSSLF